MMKNNDLLKARGKEDEQFDKMVNTPVSRLIVSLAVPTVVSMLITSIYNMADTFFVSQLGTSASAAVGIVFPIMAIIQACGFTLGMGSGSLISRRLGEQKNEEASILASTAFFTALLVGMLILAAGTSFTNAFLRVVGASETILPFARDYARYIFFGAPFMCASFVLNNALRSEGKAFFAMIGLTTGGILNMALDPLFIFGLNMGIAGAAIATLVSQFVSFSILLFWFLKKKTICTIRFSLAAQNLSRLTAIVPTGLPSMARQGLASVASILLNREAGLYGDAAIAGMAIVNRIVMFIASMIIGIGQGFSPVAGYNYGAKRFDRVKGAYRFMVLASTAVMVVVCSAIFAAAPAIIRLFRDDPDVIAIGTAALRFQVAVLPLHPLIVATNMLMQSTGRVKAALFLSCNRQGVYFIPLILLLPRVAGLLGVEMSQTVSDVLSAATAVPYALWFFRALKREAGANLDGSSGSKSGGGSGGSASKAGQV